MKERIVSTSVLSALVAMMLTVTPAVAAHAEPGAATATTALPTAADTAAALRDLWIGHVFWVRNVVVAVFAGSGDAAKAAEGEVVANAHGIAAAIEPYYGKEASDELFRLLAGHYGAVRKILDATKAGDKAARDAATTELTANATAIARFLSGANPNLPFDTLNGLLLAHGAHHLAEIDQLRDKRYADEARTWEAMKNHMYVIADALAGAIARQFPAKFR